MPPKRKGKATSPVVVGTVSTRSTRRQSVVNIEIPKLTKSKTRRGRVYGNVQTDIPTDSEDLCEKIKASYNKVVRLKTETNDASQNSESFLKDSQDSELSSPTSMNTDNKELLQILEDWSDEDSNGKKINQLQTEPKKMSEYDNLEFGVDDMNKIVNKNYLEEKTVSANKTKIENDMSFEDAKEIERTLSSENCDLETSTLPENKYDESVNAEKEDNVNEYSAVLVQHVTEQIANAKKMDLQLSEDTNNLMLSEDSQENIHAGSGVAEQTIISASEVKEFDVLEEGIPSSEQTQCEIQEEMEILQEVNEEIVSSQCEEMIVVQEDEVKQQIGNYKPKVLNIVTACEEVIMNDTDSNSNSQVEIIEVTINSEETVQSVSTSDSNDSEVRNYFTKEIERNETVHKIEEDIVSTNEDELSKSSAIDDNLLESTSSSLEAQFSEIVIHSTEGHCVQTQENQMEIQDCDAMREEGLLGSVNKSKNEQNIELSQIDVTEVSNAALNASENETENECAAMLKDTDVEVSQKTDKKSSICNMFNKEEITDGNASEEVAEIVTTKVTELNKSPKENAKTRTRKVKEDFAAKNIENAALTNKSKKIEEIKSTEKFENIEQMDIIEDAKSNTKKIQKKVVLDPIQQQTLKKKKAKVKTDDKSKNLEEHLEKTVNTAPVISPTGSLLNTFMMSKEKKTKVLDAKKKKSPPILGTKIKIKLSPSKKKRGDGAKKCDQQESKKGKEIKKSDILEVKKIKEVKKLDPDDPKKPKEFIKKVDQLESQLKEASDKSEFDNKSETDGEDIEVRRSSRIKSISVLKKKTSGYGLVKSKSEPSLNESDISDSSSVIESEKTTPLCTPSASPKITTKERKTRWSKSTETVVDVQSNAEILPNQEIIKMEVDDKPKLAAKDDPIVQTRLKQFVHLKENVYKTSRMTCKEAKRMTCDCFLTVEEVHANEYGCGEDCLNRLLLIECGLTCQIGDRCTNKRFQKGQFAPVEVFNTEKKGLGLRAAANIPYGEFILEYVGEVLNSDEFDKRAEVYSEDKNIHYYFMALRADAIIDATMKGNISRFINHSCDPNAETQKWTVNGELRIGFFSTRTILAGEEITFDYRFQRYGKEAQKCYCGASICRGWLGEEPDEESEEEEYEEEEEELVETADVSQVAELPTIEHTKADVSVSGDLKPTGDKVHEKTRGIDTTTVQGKLSITPLPEGTPSTPEKKMVKKKIPKKKPRVEMLDEIDQLDEEIQILLETGLKNQAHTLKLSRLMVRAQEPHQRGKLLRALRRGELPCRRLFLDYHGLRLMHGYMIDAQHLVVTDKKFESLRLEMLQTLAVLPIRNKTMLQDSKVLSTVEKWASSKDLTSPLDSDSNSPKTEQDQHLASKQELKKEELNKDEGIPERSVEDQEEEIRFLASKLLEEWKNLKEVFRIPKKERIEQMKEHEREANKKFMQSGYGPEGERDKKLIEMRYRGFTGKYKYEKDNYKKSSKNTEKYSAEFMKLSKIERRKLFAIQHELKEEERRLKQRELWRQHERNCLMIGTDPRFTAPFDPSKPYQCIWNPQLGQWQTYPLPQLTPLLNPQAPLPNANLGHPQISKSIPNYFTPPLPPIPTNNTNVQQLQPVGLLPTVQQTAVNISHNPHINTMGSYGGLPNVSNPMLPNLMSQNQPPVHLPSPNIPSLNNLGMPQNISQLGQVTPTSIALPMTKDSKQKEDDPSQVIFMGPIPPPVKLPPKWKCAKDKYGRPYYYHIKIRKSQWEPPSLSLEAPPTEEAEFSESESSSDSSTESSGSSSENSDSEDDLDDTKLLLEVRKQMEKTATQSTKSIIPSHLRLAEQSTSTPSPEVKFSGESDMEIDQDQAFASFTGEEEVRRTSIDIRLKEQFNLKDDKPPKKKRRVGLCEEIIISPRSEEDKLQFKEDLKRYKANKEKLRRQKELIIQQTRRQLKEVEQQRKAKEKRPRPSLKVKIKDMPDFNSETSKKIKETFRANMASTVVSSLNAYRKSDCKEGRITNTEDFKHLARKLTHFVMLKEMKHIAKIEDLLCTDNVKVKAREYIRKYMSKFGEIYVKRNDSPDFKD